MPARRLAALFLSIALLPGCFADEPVAPLPTVSGTTVAMDFAAKGDFYAAPFPSDARLAADGSVDLDGFPDPFGEDLVARIRAMLAGSARGFGTTSGIFFKLSAPIDAGGLPSVHGSLAPGSTVALIDIDPASPDYLRPAPVAVKFLRDGGPYGTANLLVVLPLQGAPLRPKTRYAAVVRRSLLDTHGVLLGASPAMVALAAGTAPDGMSDAAFASYQAAFPALADALIDVHALAGLTVFTTDAPADRMGLVTAAMIAVPPLPTKPFKRTDVFAAFCVYATTIPMPEYQQGQPPYTDAGGDWAFDASGNPVVQRQEEANFVVTIPRKPMPAAGYPMVVLSRTGAGGDRPLVDRGVQAMTGSPALVPGTGPALYFAAAGYAGSSIDGPHGGLRNVTKGNEDFLIFNIGNPVALRDNVRQSAAELALQAHILDNVSVDITDCPGAVAPGDRAHFDGGTMALMGHSMGATIAPLTLAYEPLYRAALLSGAGGSWIENVVYKLQPLAVKGFAEVLVGLAGTGYGLTEYDPVLSLFQWAGEPADPPVFARRIVHEPVDGPARHVLMMQGIVDHYILPSIANATSLSFGLDLAGSELDGTVPEIASFAPLGSLLDLSGRGPVKLPASGNVTGQGGAKTTAVVTQHPSDGIEDGHEVVFQTEGPKHEYRCFLESLLTGTPSVPGPGKAMDPCQ